MTGAPEVICHIPFVGSPTMEVRDVIKALEREGWRLDRQTGSHRQYRYPNRPGTITVVGKLSAEIPRGTLAAIWRQAGQQER